MSRDVTGRSDTAAPATSTSDVSFEAEHDPNISRRTSVAQLRQIQRKLGGGGASEGAHDAAARGVASPTTSLPFAPQIQSSFGAAHDVSSIQAHVGGDSASAMGASAYATGSHVVFDRSPDLHTAAHEAAHVVQQAQGVNLYGGVGDAGDSYERHADAVADRVVAGQSAADLLGSRGSGLSTSTVNVQRKEVKETKASKAAKQAHLDQVGPITAYTMGLILKDSNWGVREMAEMDPRSEYYKPLNDLLTLSIGHRKGGFPIPGREKREIWERMAPALSPMLAYANGDSTAELSLQEHWDHKHQEVIASEATDRVDNTIVTHEDGKDKAIEIPDDEHPHEQAEVLRAQITTLLKTSGDMVERGKNLGTALLGEEAKTVERLEHMGQTLTIMNSMLKLTDAEFQKEMRNPKSVINGIGTYTELLKTCMELSSSMVGLGASFGSFLAKRAGDEVLHKSLEAWAKDATGKGMTRIIAGIEAVHGAFVMLDSSKSAAERIDGAVEMSMGLAVLTTGESLYALPIAGPYYMVKTAAYLFREASLGWEMGFLRELFGYMNEVGGFIEHAGDHLVAAGQLTQAEKDPEKKAALAQEEKSRGAKLGTVVDEFLDRCVTGPKADHGVGTEFLDHYPGNYGIVAEVFAPLLGMRGRRTGPEAANAAAAVLKAMAYCFQHGDSIARASVVGFNLAEMQEGEREEAAKAAKKKKEEAEER